MAKFKFIPTNIPDVVLIEPTVFGDARGYFMETYHAGEFAAAGIAAPFVQDNQSSSTKGVLRGLHFQTQNTQGKLVRVIQGSVFDVAVDVRPGSPTFGQWAGAELTDENKHQLWVPEGFAHGYLVLSDTAVFTYKCTDVYNPQHEGGIIWNDPRIGIAWPDTGTPPQLSGKDTLLPTLDSQDFSVFERWLAR